MKHQRVILRHSFLLEGRIAEIYPCGGICKKPQVHESADVKNRCVPRIGGLIVPGRRNGAVYQRVKRLADDRVVFRKSLDELWTEAPHVGVGRERRDDGRIGGRPRRDGRRWQEDGAKQREDCAKACVGHWASSQVVRTLMFVGGTIISSSMRGELSRSLLQLAERDGSASYLQCTMCL